MNNVDFCNSSVRWTSPSNIALIKYWGKYGQQLPCNPSLSFTLKKSVSRFKLAWNKRGGKRGQIQLNFQGDPGGRRGQQPAFQERIIQYMDSIRPLCPFLIHYDLKMESENTFPHSTGIASSASSMSALALCLCSMEQKITGQQHPKLSKDLFLKASELARLGSGSATRSMFPKVVCWGQVPNIRGSSDFRGAPVEGIHPIFNDYRDAILIVSSRPKTLSSREGHRLMDGHPYARVRFTQAYSRFEKLLTAMREGNLPKFIEIVEAEAYTLHGLLVTSPRPHMLLHPNSLEAMERIVRFRRESGHLVCFTLDAGPNVHLLYPANIAPQVETFIKSELSPFLEKGKWLADEVGEGPVNER